jgi:uncharacterized membrane protein YfcA
VRNTSVAVESGFAAQLKRTLPAALTVCALAATALRLGQAHAAASATQAALVLLAVFIAAVVASVAGFAFSAVAAAFLSHVTQDPTEMVRTLLVCSIAIQLYCNARILTQVRWRELAPYLAGGMVTAPLGVLVLKHVAAGAYLLILGSLLLAYAVYALLKPAPVPATRRPALDVCIGALGGISGGLAAFPGAFPVMWCSARGLPKEQQRAICQPYILVMQIVTLAWLQYFAGAAAQQVTDLWPFVPVAILAAHLGYSIFQRISTKQFTSVVLVLLGVSGVALVLKAF